MSEMHPAEGARVSPHARRRASGELLVAALHPDVSVADARLGSWRAPLDWSWLLERATEHRVAGILAARLERPPAAPIVPREVSQQLGATRQAAWRQVARAQHTLYRIGIALEREGVPFIVLKGSVLGEHVYGDPLLRTSSDVDVLVPIELVFRADKAFKTLGYRLHGHVPNEMGFSPGEGEQPEPPEFLDGTSRFKEFLYVTGDAALLPVDLHWDLCNPGTTAASRLDVWSSAVPVVVAGRKMQTLDRETTILFAAVHAVDDLPCFLRLITICDLAWLLRRYRDEYRPERVLELARLWRAEACLDRALQLVGEVLRVQVDARLRPGADRSFVRRVCFGLVSRRLVDATSPRPFPAPLEWRQRFWYLLWRVALRMPAGRVLKQLTLFPVWRRVRLLVPAPLLAALRQSALLRRAVGVCE